MVGRKIDKGLIVSATAHVAVLLWAGISFAAKPLVSKPVESMPVDIISATELSEMMAGSKTAPKKEAPKKLVEKKAEPKPVEDQQAKVAEKPEIVTASTAAATPPPQETKVQAPKPAPREAKAEPKAKEPERQQPDAEALTKNDKKKEEPKKEEAKPAPPKKVEPQPKVAEPKPEPSKVDFSKIAALLDKRQPQRMAAAGDVINTTPTLGTTTGSAPRLSQNEIDALRARIQQCWNPPAGQADAKELVVQVRIQFNQDGSLAGEPRLLTRGASTYQQVAGESALRAIRRCAPYTFLPIAKYDAWKDVEVTFDPRDMFRG